MSERKKLTDERAERYITRDPMRAGFVFTDGPGKTTTGGAPESDKPNGSGSEAGGRPSKGT